MTLRQIINIVHIQSIYAVSGLHSTRSWTCSPHKVKTNKEQVEIEAIISKGIWFGSADLKSHRRMNEALKCQRAKKTNGATIMIMMMMMTSKVL